MLWSLEIFTSYPSSQRFQRSGVFGRDLLERGPVVAGFGRSLAAWQLVLGVRVTSAVP